jgi:hypothetical protein
VDAKQPAEIQIIHAIAQCKVIVYAVPIANVQQAFVKKLSDNYNR